MSDIIALAVVALIVATAGGVVVATMFPRSLPKLENRGTWRQEQETFGARDGHTVRVLLVREYKGKQTGRVVVAQIDANDPDFDERLQEAMVKADMRRETLQFGERK